MRSRRTAAFPAALLLALGLLAPPAEAAKLPDWAREIADTAPPTPEGVPPYPSRVLLSETRYGIQPDGSVRVRRRFAAQALSARAEGIGVGHFIFYDTMKVTSSKAWHLPPGERATKSWGSPADVAVGDSFLSDTKARLVQVKDIKKGSLVFYEFEALDRPRLLTESEYFFEGAPIAVDRVEVEAPEGWKVAWTWLRTKGPDPIVRENVETWEMRDVPELDDEPLSRDPIDRAPLLVVAPVPPAGTRVEPATFASWAEFSAWHEGILKGRSDVTPAIAAAAKKIMADVKGGFFDKVRAAGTFVRDKVRYVDVELGIGGMQPRPATDTLANLYGDCKDKGTLFRSILSEEAIPSYAVLINLSRDETISDTVPAWGFNHFVVAVPVPPGETIPPTFAPATVDAGDLGKVVIVDTTDEKTAIGSLSSSLGGKRGLIVAGEKGRVIDLPSGDPSVHVLVRKIRMEVGADRSVAVSRESRFTGDFAAHARAHYSASSVDRRKSIEQRVMQIWPDASVQDYGAEYETADGAFVEKIAVKLRAIPAAGSGAKLDIFPGAAEDVERVPLGKRKSAVDYEHAMTVRYEVEIAGVPAISQLPAPQESKGDGWKVTTTYAREGAAVKATWEVVLSRSSFAIDAFPELRKFWSAMAQAAGWVVSLAA